MRTLAQGVRCDDAGCAVQMADGRYVTIAKRADAFADDCEKAALIVTARQPPPACKARMIDQERLRETGSLALYSRDGTFAVRWSGLPAATVRGRATRSRRTAMPER